MEFTLHEAGYRVVTATNGEEGLAVFRSEKPTAVISDIQMPGFSGYDVLRQIKDENSDCIVIIV